MKPGLLSTRRASTARARRSDATPMFRLAVACLVPFVRWWGRLEIVGADVLPQSGPALLVANHDSAWDPLIIGTASVRRRQVHALARGSLWSWRPLGWLMDRLGAIAVSGEPGNDRAVNAAVSRLHAGDCVGLFPEGMVSRGRTLRARSGAGRIALAAPSAPLVCAAISGSADMSRFPRRPRLQISFFLPGPGDRRPGDSAAELSTRLLDEIRALVPPVTRTRELLVVEAAHPTKPRWRGWMHLVFFEVSLVVGTLLIVAARGTLETTAVVVYAASVTGLFGVSALYHRGTWSSRLRCLLQRLDHLMIFVLMAGTATPLFLLAVPGPFGVVCLVAVWSMAAVAATVHLTWMQAPDWVVGSSITALGVVGALAVPAVWQHVGVAAGVLFVTGGLLYALGAVSLHRHSPDPWPTIFGYHEVFHSYVTAAAICHYVAVALLVL